MILLKEVGTHEHYCSFGYLFDSYTVKTGLNGIFRHFYPIGTHPALHFVPVGSQQSGGDGEVSRTDENEWLRQQ